MNKDLEKSFLKGEHKAIYALGAKFMSVNSMETIPVDQVSQFMGGWTPEYLHEIGKGWGMSTADAVRCLFDYQRTSKFVIGIGQAVQHLKEIFPGQRLTAVEAGTGTGILSIALATAGIDEVQALEINKSTAASARKFVTALDLEEKIKVIDADATNYKSPKGIHLLLSENMHTGLFLEPQVQIVNHLKDGLLPGGVILPEAVSLNFATAQADWDEIGANQAELMNTNGHIKRIGEYGFLPKLVFSEAAPEDPINLLLPISSKGNALVSEMDVHIFRRLTLASGEAKFLGQPHITKCQVEDGPGRFGFAYYFAGGSPPNRITPLED